MTFFKVIVEMFPVSESDRHHRSFLNEALSDQKELINILKDTIGIYSFYNSEMEIIYLGKTKNNLWDEMKTAYTRSMPHYKKYFVNHPNGKFKRPAGTSPRKLQLRELFVWETAEYFSAYSVDHSVIDDVERFMIRIMPNDIANKRMEGNGSLDVYAQIEKG